MCNELNSGFCGCNSVEEIDEEIKIIDKELEKLKEEKDE